MVFWRLGLPVRHLDPRILRYRTCASSPQSPAIVQRSIPVKTQASGRIAITLAQRAADGADAARIADAIVSTWEEIQAALGPIIGPASVALLYKRSLHLIGPAHPWLADANAGLRTAMDLAALKSVLVQQTGVHAAAAGGEILQTFYELLASLVGPSLTDQLLRSVWANTFSGPPAQDPTP